VERDICVSLQLPRALSLSVPVTPCWKNESIIITTLISTIIMTMVMERKIVCVWFLITILTTITMMMETKKEKQFFSS